MAAILAAFCLAGSVNADVLSNLEGQKDELQQQQQELEDRSKALNERLEQLKDDEAHQQEYYNSLEEQIDVVETQIDTANERLDQLDDEIVQLQDDLKEAQAQLDADFDTLKERLCALYGECRNAGNYFGSKEPAGFGTENGADVCHYPARHPVDGFHSLSDGRDGGPKRTTGI